MRTLACVMLIATLIGAIPSQAAQAATQFSLWPAEFSYGTPSGTFTWNSTVFGLHFGQPLGPFVGFDTNLQYGSVSNLNFGGTSLSGYSGSTLVADSVLRVGLRAGTLGIAAFGGYGGIFFNASDPATSGSVVLQSLGSRLGVEATLAMAPGLTLRGNYTVITSLTARADIAVPPAVPTQWNGTGTGSEYEIALLFSPVPVTTVFAGYRGGTQSISWSGAGTTPTSFNGWVAGVELHF